MTDSTLEQRTNFDALRLLAVGLVVVGNGLVLTGGVPPGLWGAPLPRIGLDFLFAIGGFLAVASVGRSASSLTFVLARIRRVFPALVTSVVLTAFVIGPLATTLPRRAYLLAVETRRYLYNAVLLPRLFLPRTFEGQQWSGAANPTLWTLGAYLGGCGVVLLLSRLDRSWRGPAAFICAALLGLSYIVHPPDMVGTQTEMPFFFVGAALGFAEQRTLWRADLAMLCFAGTWIVATWVGEWTIVVEWLTVPYMAACFGRMALPGLASVGWIGNPSFGLYLYAFPLQQLIVARWPAVAHPILLCLAGATVLGLLSWHLVERPALRRLRLRPSYA